MNPLNAGYTGHSSKNPGIQRHSMSDAFAQHQIIMEYLPVKGIWQAVRHGVVLAFSKSYELALGAAVIRHAAEPAMNGHTH